MENKILKDHLGAPFRVGAPCVWTTHNMQWIGTIIKVCRSRIKVKPLPGTVEYTWTGLPFPNKVIQLDSMPKSALFVALKNV